MKKENIWSFHPSSINLMLTKVERWSVLIVWVKDGSL